MFDFIDNVKGEIFDEFINILDVISFESFNLYEKITENLIVTLRTKFKIPRCGDKFLV